MAKRATEKELRELKSAFEELHSGLNAVSRAVDQIYTTTCPMRGVDDLVEQLLEARLDHETKLLATLRKLRFELEVPY